MKMNRKTLCRPMSVDRFRASVITMLLALSFMVSVACRTQRRPSELQLRSFEFETVTVNVAGEITDRRKRQARYFVEDLGGVGLEMVEIPAGKFQMGTSPAEVDEEKRVTPHGPTGNFPFEMPQHEVVVPSFYLGKYEVTQAQWKAVAKLPKVSLKLDPDPSHFEGDNLPVEQVSWDEAMEFCARLSKVTGRTYRLPTEAEWEYACRAGTTTPFAFGEGITKELAGFMGQSPVGATGIANGFGLYDMHANVQEWCLDVWHDDYNGAPTDGGAWQTGRKPIERVMRGGSHGTRWDSRSASREPTSPARWNSDVGFRVVAVARPPLTLANP
jgi:formylglycine-generating enzyme required for sulfatase activity